MGSSPIYSPSSDKRFWSNLRSRVDTLLENRENHNPAQKQLDGAEDRSKRMKEDAMLLLRGFDSVSSSLSLLSDNLENALQGARDLAKPPTLTDILHCTMEKASRENQSKEGKHEGDEEKEETEEGNKGLKRKLDECSEDSQQDDDTKKRKWAGLETYWEVQESQKSCNFHGVKSSHVSSRTEISEIRLALYARTFCSVGGGE